MSKTNPVPTSVQLHWSGATRYHDWRADRCAIPKHMLDTARRLGVIGSVDWFSVGHDGEREEVEHKEGVLERILDRPMPRSGSHMVEAGGQQPFPWHLNLLLFPYQESVEQVQGYNILNIWFDSEAFSGEDGSDTLVRAFREVHTPGNTEFAFIHPYERWSKLSESLDGEYGDPLTIGPMFSGVYWAVFLGARHLEFFDVSELADLDAFELEWIDRDGLFLRVSRDVADAASAAVEEEMFRLTEKFRNALRDQ